MCFKRNIAYTAQFGYLGNNQIVGFGVIAKLRGVGYILGLFLTTLAFSNLFSSEVLNGEFLDEESLIFLRRNAHDSLKILKTDSSNASLMSEIVIALCKLPHAGNLFINEPWQIEAYFLEKLAPFIKKSNPSWERFNAEKAIPAGILDALQIRFLILSHLDEEKRKTTLECCLNTIENKIKKANEKNIACTTQFGYFGNTQIVEKSALSGVSYTELISNLELMLSILKYA